MDSPVALAKSCIPEIPDGDHGPDEENMFDSITTSKRKWVQESSDCDTDTESRKSRRSKVASAPRGERTTAAQREAALREDKWILDVQPHSVKCRGCNSLIALNPNSNRHFDRANWHQHREKCSQITGTKVVRVAAVTVGERSQKTTVSCMPNRCIGTY